MADPQYTDAQLSDGTTLRFNGQLDPDQVKTKVAAYRAARAPVQHHGAGSGWGPEFDSPDNLSAKLGSYVPEALTSPLAWLQRNYVQPTEKYISAVSSTGRELGRETLGMGSDPNVQKKYGMEKSVPLQSALGAAGAVGSVAATTVADPRNWPLMASSAARPILQRLMSAGFGAQMGTSAINSTKQLYDNWDKLNPEQRAELATSAGITTLMARASVDHAIRGGHPAGPETSPGRLPAPNEFQVKAEAAQRNLKIPETAGPATKAPVEAPPPSISAEVADLGDYFVKTSRMIGGDMSTANPKAIALHNEIVKALKEKTGGDEALFNRVIDEAEARAARPPANPVHAHGQAPELTPNASGESAASQEAINRQASQRAQGIKTFRVDTRSGRAVPIIGVDAVDATAKPYEKIVQIKGDQVTEVDSGPGAKPLDESKLVASTSGVSRSAATSPAATSTEVQRDSSPLAKTSTELITPPTSPEKTGEGFTLPKQGEVVDAEHNYPSKETMAFRGIKKLEYSQRGLRTAIATGDTAEIDAAQERVIRDASDWAKYARPEEVNQAMQRLHNNASLLADQIGPMQNLNKGLFQGKVSFRESADPSVQQMSRGDFRKIAGKDLPKIPKDYLDSLPEDVRNALPPKGRERQEAIGRLWATDFLEHRGKELVSEFDRARELQAAIAKTRGLTPPTRESYFLPKNVPVTEATADTQVGRAATASTESQQAGQQPVQAAATTARPGEPVRAAEGPSLAEPPSKAEAPADAEAERLKQLATPAKDANFFALAQQDLRKTLGREPSISEVAQHAAVLKGRFSGIEDPQLEARIKMIERRGVARGTAERMAKEQLAKEREEDAIRAQQAARPGERGSLSFRRLQPMIGPRGPSPAWRLASFLDRLAGGDRSPQEQRARDITREFASDLALEHLRLEAKLKEAIERHDTDGEDEFRAFMDAGEGKIAQGPVNWSAVGPNSPHPQAPFMNVEDVGTAQELHGMFQERWQTVQQILDKEPGGIENYLAHLWKRPGMAKKGMNYFFGRRPVEGNKIFLKQRFYEYASDGLDRGLEPITYNPIRMQLTALFQMDKFIAAHELKDMYHATGLIEWTRLGDKSNPDWVPLNDKIFQPKVMKGGGLTEYGQYKAPADVARIFNNYVAPGLRGNPTYDAIRQYGNFLNQMNLGASAYHGMFITGVSAASDIGLGLEKVFNNLDYKGGVKDILRGSLPGLSAIKDYQLGKKIQAEAINPTGNTNLQAYVDSLVQGGARFDQDPMYRNTAGKQFLGQLKSGKIFDGLGNMAKAGVQNFPVTKFIMEKYVPRIKLGMAASMMESQLGFLIKQGTTDPATIAHEMGKVWDSVDNRAGQMVYDNLFWNKVAKDVSFLGIRAVGWDFGSMREGIGAGRDILQQSAGLLRGERPVVTHRMAFVAGVATSMALLGAVTTYMVTGKAPQNLEDYYYPYSGRTGPDGKPERMSYPSYIKDGFAIAHDVHNLKADTALHKLHPMINQVVEFLQNKDYYNNEIRSEGDPWSAQLLQTGKWYGKSFLPFGATMGYNRAHAGIPALEAYGESFLGLQKAPAYVTQTPAEEMTLDFAKRHWQAGPLTSREREQRDTYNMFRGQMAEGKLDTNALGDAFIKGKLRSNDLDRLFDSQNGMSAMEQEFKSSSIKLPEALKIMKIASPQERERLKPLLIDKMDQLDEFTVPEEQAFYLDQMQKYLQ